MTDLTWIDEILEEAKVDQGNIKMDVEYNTFYEEELKQAIATKVEQLVVEARIDELNNIVAVMSGIPVSEQGQYLIGDTERRIKELKATHNTNMEGK